MQFILSCNNNKIFKKVCEKKIKNYIKKLK